ncbi:MAG: hypothetical protein Q8L53_03555 [Aestuariivirga sp.]|nr:hypothetical protein [Aestuariivirga sp.]
MSNITSISSDLINRRLSGAGQKTFYEPDVELADAEFEQSEGMGMSAGFIVKMVVLFVAVGGGTFFFDGSAFSWYELKLAVGDLSRFML